MRCWAASAILVAACAAAKPPAPFETALRRGEREERSGRTGEATAAYGRAVEHCGARPADCALARYRRARMLERAGAREEAMHEYVRSTEADPEGPYVGQSLLYAARIAAALGNDSADSWYDAVIFGRSWEGVSERALRERLDRIAPARRLAWLEAIEPRLRRTDLGDDVLWLEAGLQHEAGDGGAEGDALETLVRRHTYPHAELWDDARWRLADLAEARGDAAAAIRWLRPLSDAYESSSLVGSYALPKMDDAALRIARLELEARHDPIAAERDAQDLLDRFDDSDLRDDAMFLSARARLARGDREGACDRVGALRDEYPRSKWLKRERLEGAGLRCTAN